MAAIASAPPVVSSATSSSEPRLFANSSSSSRRVLTRPAERTSPSSEIATSQNSRWTSKPMYLITGLLLFVADAGDQVGKRHRRIRARGTSGPVAAAATEKHGLAAHRANGLPNLRSPKQPLVPQRPTLRLEPDAQLTGTQGCSFMAGDAVATAFTESGPAPPEWLLEVYPGDDRDGDDGRGNPVNDHAVLSATITFSRPSATAKPM